MASPGAASSAASATRRKRRLLSALTSAENYQPSERGAASETELQDGKMALERKKRRPWGPAEATGEATISESARLRRAASSLGIEAPAPRPTSLGPRQLSAAAIDAAMWTHELALPTVRSSEHPDLNVISPETVARVLGGEFRDRLAAFELIDCRFPFEHVGGSLRGSRSLFDPVRVEEAFMAQPRPDSARVALIFFCEFSANRAPKMARHVRNLDRWIHADRYPELFYPELYLIDGGYKNCFEKLKGEICEPPTYVSMNDEKFSEECRAEFSAWRRRWKAHKTNDCAKQWRGSSSASAEPKRSTGTAAAAAAKWRKAHSRPKPVQSLLDML